jgi:uncharacterized membrane protein HdeD (DUF308 family)
MGDQRPGWVTFAGVLLLIAGVLNVIFGIAAIGDSDFFDHQTHYLISDLNTWGWVTLILGVLEILAAFSLWRGGLYGRLFGIAVAGLSAMGAMLSIAAYPLWSLALFAVDLIIIGQLAIPSVDKAVFKEQPPPPA